ncbi:MAG: hypothetical protein V6Z82_07020 [Flavobacteriales bacterium]
MFEGKIKNPRYNDENKTVISFEFNHSEFGWIPSSLNVGDGCEYPERCEYIMENMDIMPYIAPEPVEPTEYERKLMGVEFQGVMCSATKEDMWGLASVKDWVKSGAVVPFKFDNGNTLVLTNENYEAFQAVWIPFRASFFQA